MSNQVDKLAAELSFKLQEAVSTGQWLLAVEVASKLRREFPSCEDGYVTVIPALRALRDFAEADRIIEQAIEQFGEKLNYLVILAETATDNENWEAAASRWMALRDIYPNAKKGWLRGAVVLGRLRRHEEAEALISHALSHFEQEQPVLIAGATVAMIAGNWELGFSRWNTLHTKFPSDKRGYERKAVCLRKMGQASQADDVIREYLDRFEANVNTYLFFVDSAIISGDWEEANKRLKETLEKFPESPRALRKVTEVSEGWSMAIAASAAPILVFPDNQWLLGNSKYLVSELIEEGRKFFYVAFNREEIPCLARLNIPFITLSVLNSSYKDIVTEGTVCYYSTVERMRLETDAADHIEKTARKIQMWHGFPIKIVGMGDLPDDVIDQRIAKYHERPSQRTFCCSSEKEKVIHERAFLADHFETTGYARTDIFYRDAREADFVNVTLSDYDKAVRAKIQGKKVIVVMFTWLSDRTLYAAEYSRLRAMADEEPNTLFIIKPHTNERSLANFSPSENFFVMSKRDDPYIYLRIADFMLTDVSSIAIDVLHANLVSGNSKAILYTKRLDQYKEAWNKGRGVNDVPYDQLGTVVDDFENVLGLVRGEIEPNEVRSEAYEYFLTFTDGQSSKRLLNLLQT